MVQEAVKPPLLVVAVMTAVPLPIAVTLPFVSTVATAMLLLCHVMVLSVALEGVTVAVRSAVRGVVLL